KGVATHLTHHKRSFLMSNLNTTPASPSLHDYCFGGNGFEGIPALRCCHELLSAREGVPMSFDEVEATVAAWLNLESNLGSDVLDFLRSQATLPALEELHAFHVELFVARTAEVQLAAMQPAAVPSIAAIATALKAMADGSERDF